MSVNKSKSKIIRIGKPVNTFNNDKEHFDFDQVLACKYLGVIVQNKTGTYFNDFAQSCVKKARNCRFSIIQKAKESWNVKHVARELWNKCAVPTILYGSEVIPIRKQELNKLNSEAASLGKFILQLPKNTTNITAFIMSGIDTIEYHYYKRVLGYKYRMEKMDNTMKVKRIYNFIMSSEKPFGYKTNLLNIEKKVSKKGLDQWYVDMINDQKSIHPSSCWLLPKKQYPGDINNWLSESYDDTSRIVAEFMTMNAGLGNRGPVKTFQQHKLCQLCIYKNQAKKLNEIHVLFGCEQLKKMYDKYGITRFAHKINSTDPVHLYRKFWSGKFTSEQIAEKVNIADSIRHIYLTAMKGILRGNDG